MVTKTMQVLSIGQESKTEVAYSYTSTSNLSWGKPQLNFTASPMRLSVKTACWSNVCSVSTKIASCPAAGRTLATQTNLKNLTWLPGPCSAPTVLNDILTRGTDNTAPKEHF